MELTCMYMDTPIRLDCQNFPARFWQDFPARFTDSLPASYDDSGGLLVMKGKTCSVSLFAAQEIGTDTGKGSMPVFATAHGLAPVWVGI